MPTPAPFGGIKCAMRVPLDGVEWHVRETAQLRGHRGGSGTGRQHGSQGHLAHPCKATMARSTWGGSDPRASRPLRGVV